jgi:hypothetical protein
MKGLYQQHMIDPPFSKEKLLVLFHIYEELAIISKKISRFLIKIESERELEV